MKTHYQRRLPHIVPPGATIFYTFRLAESVPQAIMQQLAAEQELAITGILRQFLPTGQRADELAKIKKQHFVKYETLLDGAAYGPTWLREPAVAGLVRQEIHALSTLDVAVVAYCIMPNHVHLVVQLPEKANFHRPE